MSCEICNMNQDDDFVHICKEDGKYTLKIWSTFDEDFDDIYAEVQINYCPICGKDLYDKKEYLLDKADLV